MYPVSRKENAWEKVLAASDEEAKERCKESYREEKIRVKRCIYQNKKKVNSWMIGESRDYVASCMQMTCFVW